MKILISAILLVSILVISVQAYDYATESAKITACNTKLTTVYNDCQSDTACKADTTANNTCLDLNTAS